MSTIDLIILGLLFENAMSPYDLVCHISDRQIGKFLKISAPAIYKRCKGLAAEGSISGKVIKEGALPEKTVYSISKKGKERFYLLMGHFSSNITPFFLDCNAFVWNIEKIDKKTGLQMLVNLQKEFMGLKIWIFQHEKEVSGYLPFSSRMIVKQYRMILLTLLEWIKDVITDYKSIKQI